MIRGDQVGDRILSVESVLSGDPNSVHYLRGLVRLSWGEQAGQLTADAAEAHALRILTVAAGARQDEALVRFALKELELPLEAAVAMLAEFRRMRG